MNDTNWHRLIEVFNELHTLIQAKPNHIKIGYRLCPGGILNAYREGDITFEKALDALEVWAARHRGEPRPDHKEAK